MIRRSGYAQDPVVSEVLSDRAALARPVPGFVAARSEVALAFLTRRASVFAIPKAGRLTHVEDNAGALGLVLSASDMARIDAAFPRGRKPASLPMI